jgi:hypothetical protein
MRFAKSRKGETGQTEVDRRRRSWRYRVLAAIIGMALAGTCAFAVSNWVVGLNGGSSGQAQSGGVSNLTITATATPSPSNLLYPGGAGDVVISISNPNPFPVTISAFNLPDDNTFATGYTTNTLGTEQTGCINTTPSEVIWNYSTSSSGSSHSLTSNLVVAANGSANNPLVVTLTNDALMNVSAPAACENTYFSMPSFTGITAAAGGTPTTSPTTDAWTS